MVSLYSTIKMMHGPINKIQPASFKASNPTKMAVPEHRQQSCGTATLARCCAHISVCDLSSGRLSRTMETTWALKLTPQRRVRKSRSVFWNAEGARREGGSDCWRLWRRSRPIRRQYSQMLQRAPSVMQLTAFCAGETSCWRRWRGLVLAPRRQDQQATHPVVVCDRRDRVF